LRKHALRDWANALAVISIGIDRMRLGQGAGS
jgi:hypothetical protein